jgi:hypothetical protein
MARRVLLALFAAGLGAWIVNAAILWLSGAPLGHDEAQYALAAHDALAGAPPRWFYLSTGMTLVAAPGVAAGGSEIALRALPFLCGIGFALALAQLARTTFGPAGNAGAEIAAWTLGVVAGTRSYMRLGAELLSDVPATACLLAGTVVVVHEVMRDDGPRWRALVAAPFLAAALYLRYASCVPIAILGVAALALGWRTIVRRPWPIVGALALFAALLVPHAARAVEATGSPLGILLESGRVPLNAYAGEGLVTYLTMNPFYYYGVLATPLMIAGLVAVWRADRRVRLLWIVAIADFIAMGLISHAQVRYVFYPTSLLVVLGVGTIWHAIRARPPRVQRAAFFVAAMAIATTWIAIGISHTRHRAGRTAGNRATLIAAEAIRADAAGARCLVTGDHYTQLEWYSGCRVEDVSPADSVARRLLVYVVLDPKAPTIPNLADFPAQPQQILRLPGVVEVYRFGR